MRTAKQYPRRYQAMADWLKNKRLLIGNSVPPGAMLMQGYFTVPP